MFFPLVKSHLVSPVAKTFNHRMRSFSHVCIVKWLLYACSSPWKNLGFCIFLGVYWSAICQPWVRKHIVLFSKSLEKVLNLDPKICTNPVKEYIVVIWYHYSRESLVLIFLCGLVIRWAKYQLCPTSLLLQAPLIHQESLIQSAAQLLQSMFLGRWVRCFVSNYWTYSRVKCDRFFVSRNCRRHCNLQQWLFCPFFLSLQVFSSYLLNYMYFWQFLS